MSLDPKTERLAEAVATALGHYLAWIQEQPGLKNTPEVTASLETSGAWMKKFHFCISLLIKAGDREPMEWKDDDYYFREAVELLMKAREFLVKS